MSNICDNVISAIDILTNQKIAEAGYDRTIEAQVISCVDLANKKYKLRYQNSTIYALASESYSKGDIVLVTIPQNNNNTVKRIIGLSESKSIKSTSLSDIYEPIGANGVLNEDEFSIPAKESYSIEILNGENDLDQDIIKQSIKSSNSLVVTAAFKTNLTEQQIASKGDYGLEFNLVFLDGKTKEEILQQYVLNINYIEGFPYELYNYTYTTATFDNIDGVNFDRIESINFYSKKFSFEDNEKRIFIKDISIIGAKKIDAINQAGIMVSILAKDGYYFIPPKTRSSIKPLTLTAQVRDDGKVIEIDPINTKFYWFRENPLVNSSHDYYNRYGNDGWACLNEREPLYDDEGNIKVDNEGNIQYSRNWISATAQYSVNPTDIRSKSANFKCVIVSGAEQDNSEIATLYHTDANIETYNIVSTNEGNIEKLECLPYNSEFIYKWVCIKNNGTIIQLTEGNKLEVNLTSIDDRAEYCCVVTQDLGGFPIANPKIILQENKINDPFYRVVIKNGERMFLYNEDGAAKAYDIPALEAVLYNPEGQVIPQDQYSVNWESPVNSLIQIKTQFNEDEEINGNYFYYTIAPRYRQSLKNAEQIKAIVNYGGIRVEGYTDIMFAREGELGTNGTGAYCIIKPNISENTVVDFYPTYIVDGDIKSWNFASIDTNMPFIAELWTGMDSSVMPDSIKWSLLSQILSNTNSVFTVTNDGVITYNGIHNDTVNDGLIKAELYKDSKYYSSVVAPLISLAFMPGYSMELKYGTGFQDILFSSDGRNTNFLDRPFEVKVYKDGTLIAENLNYSWYILQQEDILKIKSQTENTVMIDIEYSAQYNGKNNTTYLACYATSADDSTEILAVLYIPIYMHLNTYSNAAINGWDGNSLQLNKDGSAYLLAPQVGAGTKNADNSFTGIVMGEVQDSNEISKVGLFGYNKGTQTIFLDSKSGAATFGSSEDNQIILDPNSGKVTVHGDIYANNGTFSGKIEAKDGYLQNLTISGKLNYSGSNFYIGTGSFIPYEGHEDYINIPNFRVGNNSAQISSFNFNDTALTYDINDGKRTSSSIYIGKTGIQMGQAFPIYDSYDAENTTWDYTSEVSLGNKFINNKYTWNLSLCRGGIDLYSPTQINSENDLEYLDGVNTYAYLYRPGPGNDYNNYKTGLQLGYNTNLEGGQKCSLNYDTLSFSYYESTDGILQENTYSLKFHPNKDYKFSLPSSFIPSIQNNKLMIEDNNIYLLEDHALMIHGYGINYGNDKGRVSLSVSGISVYDSFNNLIYEFPWGALMTK